jgi:hypothetical protein
MNCSYCKKKMTKREIDNYESGESNWASWCGLDKFASCSKCDKIMCDECHGPCKYMCLICKNICHSFWCDNISDECNHRCKCYDKEIPDLSEEGESGIPLTILQRKRLSYYKRMIKDIIT